MSEYELVRSVAEFNQLDDGEMLEGYLGGFHGDPPPGSDRSRSYWHGWRNGCIDSRRMQPDDAYDQLAQDFLRVVH